MAEVMPLMLALQKVLSDSRPLDARDYHPSTTQGGTPVSATDFAELRARAVLLQRPILEFSMNIRLREESQSSSSQVDW